MIFCWRNHTDYLYVHFEFQAEWGLFYCDSFFFVINFRGDFWWLIFFSWCNEEFIFNTMWLIYNVTYYCKNVNHLSIPMLIILIVLFQNKYYMKNRFQAHIILIKKLTNIDYGFLSQFKVFYYLLFCTELI